MPLFIPFLVKGAIFLGKAIITHHKATVVAKGLIAASKTYGTAAVVNASVLTAMTIGGILWTQERIEDVEVSYELWEQKDYQGMAKRLTSLFSKFSTIENNPQTVVHSLKELLHSRGFEKGKVIQFIRDASETIEDVLKGIKK